AMCNACHYYYGGQHAGMSCGNASCHEANSLHRIIHVTQSGSSYLWSEPSHPTTTPEIDTVAGHIGSNELVVTFTEGVWTKMDQTGPVETSDLLLTDQGGDNPRTITSVTHTPGEASAILTMSAPLIEADLSTDILATVGVAVWDADGEPAGPWPMTITGPARVGIMSVEGILGHDQLYVTFSEPVYANTDATGDLAPDDFTLTDTDDGRTITGVTHTAGESAAVLTLDLPLDETNDIDVDMLAAAADSVYDAYGNAADAAPVTITAVSSAPLLDAVWGVDGHDRLAVRFSTRVYANADATGALQPADFVLIDGGAGKSVIGVEHSPGSYTATIVLDGIIEAADIGSAALAPAGGSIFNAAGYPAPTTAATLASGVQSFIAAVEGVVGNPALAVTFGSQAFANGDQTGALNGFDFTLIAGGKSIIAVEHAAGNSTAIVFMDGILDVADIGGATLAAVSDSIFGPSAGNFPFATDTATVNAQAAPSITRAEGALDYDRLFVSFSEGVYAENNGTGDLGFADFTYTDAGAGGAASAIAVIHSAGDSSAIVVLDGPLLGGDIGADTLEATGTEIFNRLGNPVGTTPLAVTGNDCPVWGTSFPIEDEPQYSATIEDETSLLVGTVGLPTFSFPDPDNDWFNGDDGLGTYVDMNGNLACLSSPRAITVEARVRPTEVDRGVADNTFNRIFERRRNLLVTILNTDYRGDDIPSRAGRASIEVKYRVDNASRHTCPHPQWPDDPYVGNDVKMHQISSDIELFPIVDGHWYTIRVVFNSDKADVPGSDGTPVDVFIDDEGADGLNSPNPTPLDPSLNPDFEQWPGYANATRSINGSSSCKWGALPGDFIEYRDDSSHIGASQNHNQPFEGQIDWLIWQPIADYSGVDESPH
ncbi:MAG: hypothetical protein ACYSUI_13860, partial [Planctomycetota bacterium]